MEQKNNSINIEDIRKFVKPNTSEEAIEGLQWFHTKVAEAAAEFLDQNLLVVRPLGGK